MKPDKSCEGSRVRARGVSLVVTVLWPWLASGEPAPTVQHCEPPNWWVEHSLNPVRLLVTGEHLAGATVKAPPGFLVTNITGSEDGRHLLFSLRIPSPSEVTTPRLEISNAGGTAPLAFPLLARPERSGRFSGFSTDDVIYLLMPDRFANGDPANDDPPASRGLFDRSKPRHYHGGDFAGVISRLPYLRELGVTALWLTPWYDNVNHLNTQEKYTHDNRRSSAGDPVTDYHGYGAVDFYGVEEHFGDLPQLQSLVRAAHTNGFKFIQDQVANHTGPYHPWVTHPPTPTWFNGTAAQHLDNSWQTWTLAQPDAPADQKRSTLEGWFINILPDLNQNDPETAAYLIQNSLWWVGMTGLDAIRQDTLPYVPRSYWSQWTTALKREFPRLTVLGEMWDGKPELVAFFQGGRARFDGVDSGIETLFDFPLYYAVREVFAHHGAMTQLSRVFAADTNYVNPRGLVTFLGLHDLPRFLSEPGATPRDLQLAFTLLCTARGTPLIYYGDEIALRGGNDPDNRRDFPGGWKEDAQNAFRARGRTTEQEPVHAHLRKLLRLRRELEPLRRGEMKELAATPRTFAFSRATSNSTVVVAFNLGAETETLKLSLASANPAGAKHFTDRLGKLGRFAVAAGVLTVPLPARSAAILTPDANAGSLSARRSADR